MTKSKSKVYFTVAYSEAGSRLAWRYVRYLGTDKNWHPKLDEAPIKHFKTLPEARKAAGPVGKVAVEKGWAECFGIARIEERVSKDGTAREITFINASAK